MWCFKNRSHFITLPTKPNQKHTGIHPRKDLLLFDSFGFAGFKQFIVDNDESIIDKMLPNLGKFNKKDIKISLESLTFSLESYNKVKEKSQLENLTYTVKDFFHLCV